jgi:hypothetical protein
MCVHKRLLQDDASDRSLGSLSDSVDTRIEFVRTYVRYGQQPVVTVQ